MAFGNQEAALLFKIKGDTSDADRALASLDAKTAGLGTSLGGLGTVFTAAAGAAAALAAAAVQVGSALFSLSQQAAEYGSKLKDASDKTGLSATSLSALKIAADQSGSSLEQVAGSVSKFSKTVGEAANGSKEAAAKMKQLGVEPQEAIANLDGALAKVFQKIVDAKPGVEQTTLATAAFGKAGADMIPVLKSFDGDMESLIRRAEDLGVVFDDVAAREADEFGDTMDDLSLAVKGLGMTIGRELIPDITALARSFTQFIVNNKAYVQQWAADTAIYLRGVVRAWKEAAAAAREYMAWANAASGGAVESVRSASRPWFMGAGLGAATYLFGDYLYSKGSEYRAADDEGTFIPGERPKPSIFDVPAGGGGGGGGRRGGGARTAPRLDGINAVIGAGMDSAAKIEAIKRQYRQALANLGPDLGQAIKDHAARYGIPEAIAFAQIFSESSFRPGALSTQGAAGLTQVLPETASRSVQMGGVGRQVSAQDLMNDPELALTAWGNYMTFLYKRYGSWDLAILAYHQGEGTVDKLVAQLNAGKGGTGVIGKNGRTYAQRMTALAGSALSGSAPTDALRPADQTRQAEEKAREDRIKEMKDEGRQVMALLKAQNETELAELKAKLDAGELLNSAYVKRVGEIREGEIETQRTILETIANDEAASAEDRMDALNELAILDEKIAKQRIENSAAVKAALEDEASAMDDVKKGIEGIRDAIGLPGFDTKEKKEGDPGTDGEGIFGAWTRSWKEFFGAITGDGPKLGEMLGQVAGMMQGAFTQIAQGIGSVVQNWVLMGETGPAVMRKLLASALASLAAEAATRAIFELAMGFAALFFNPAEATAHFTAAALFGSIAVGTALAGRAIAGDSFKQKTAPSAATGANTQGSRSGSGGAYSTQGQMTVNGGRNAPSGPSGVLVIKDRSGMFDRLFEAAWQNNGPMRRRLMQEFST